MANKRVEAEVCIVTQSKMALSIEAPLPDQKGVIRFNDKQVSIGVENARGTFKGYSVAWETLDALRTQVQPERIRQQTGAEKAAPHDQGSASAGNCGGGARGLQHADFDTALESIRRQCEVDE